MFGLGSATKIYISLDAVDMRKGFDGLYGLVRDHLGQDPQSGHLFLFTNRSQTRLDMLVRDGSGLWVCARRQWSAQHHHEAGRTGDVGERLGPNAGPSAQELDGAHGSRVAAKRPHRGGADRAVLPSRRVAAQKHFRHCT